MDSINILKQKLTDIKTKLNYPQHQENLKSLEEISRKSDFWNNPQNAQLTMKKLSQEKELIDSINFLDLEISNVFEYQKLIDSSPDHDFEVEIDQNLLLIETKLSELEMQTYLSGIYDDHDAIFAIHSGQGGTEAMDWASMLQRMYQRYFEKKKWHFELLDSTPGEEAGIKSAYIRVRGTKVYGLLRKESGVHRLVRLSPFNADNLRQTSFAKVEVTPVFENDADVEIKPEDIEFAAYRSGGHGGQNVNKVSTAVRLTHTPSGFTVSCQSQRSQDQNRLVAMDMLYAKLWAAQQEKKTSETKEIKGDNVVAGWGHQIRSYVLHPYKMVKDLRTRYESSDTTAILDGDLDGFIQSELKL